MWLSSWSDASANPDGDSVAIGARVGIFAGIGILESRRRATSSGPNKMIIAHLFLALAFVMALIGMLYGTNRASHQLHNPMLDRILRAPTSFFDSTPVCAAAPF